MNTIYRDISGNNFPTSQMRYLNGPKNNKM